MAFPDISSNFSEATMNPVSVLNSSQSPKSFISVCRIYLLCLIVSSNLFIASQASATNDKDVREIVIAEQNIGKSVIVVSDSATAQIKTAAAELAKYIKISTGADIKLQKFSEVQDDPDRVRIIVKTGNLQKAENGNNFAASDEFSITFPDKRTLVISGATDWGTEFGVYGFLERYVGVRWLTPGSAGEHVPLRKKLSVPIKDVREKPAFESRHMSGLWGPEQNLWARRNRMHDQIRFHHNLLNLFPPAKYTKTHPEFFPIIKGNRYLPQEGTEHQWQPCFSAPGIVEEAIKNICDYFAKHPEETSYSLGVNDSGGHCECDACRAKRGAAKNFVGFWNMSDTYFEWANAVVEGVLKHYPDKWFGCLAYSEIAQAPLRIRVHPRIVPFLTYDRMKWIDARFEKQGKAITESWGERANYIGWYDYIYGTPYLVPRVYFHKMADYYRYGHRHGVRAMYAEAYPNWGEGPKLYIALRLQWNPYLDVDNLLNEWYEKCVGREAAPFLQAYYDLWENFWTKKATTSKWFSTNSQYLVFSEPGYVALITDEIAQSRNLLEKVISKAKTPDQKRRATLILRAFEYYEASVLSYQYKNKCDGLKGIFNKNDCDLYKKMEEKRFSLVDAFENDAVLRHPVRFDKRKILQW